MCAFVFMPQFAYVRVYASISLHIYTDRGVAKRLWVGGKSHESPLIF